MVALVIVCGMSTLVYFTVQPRPVQKISFRQFESHQVLVDALLASLAEEIAQSPLLILGVEPDQPESIQIWKLFLAHNQKSGSSYDVVVADQFLNGADDIKDVQKLDTKADVKILIKGLEDLRAQGKRIAILVPNIYSVQMIPGNVASLLKIKFPDLLSLTMANFPRSREQEKLMPRRCITGLDESGLGPFGCLLAQTARSLYMKRMQPGSQIGLMNQIGLKDYIILYTKESQ